jgi:catechol 2,3-dioxygenase-like lactoylglutathione lyase family enzyme
MEPRIRLITLGVAELERSVRFYRDGLGWPMSSAEDLTRPPNGIRYVGSSA